MTEDTPTRLAATPVIRYYTLAYEGEAHERYARHVESATGGWVAAADVEKLLTEHARLQAERDEALKVTGADDLAHLAQWWAQRQTAALRAALEKAQEELGEGGWFSEDMVFEARAVINAALAAGTETP